MTQQKIESRLQLLMVDVSSWVDQINPGRPVSAPIAKLIGEAKEFQENPTDISEAADVLLCLLDACIRNGWSTEELIKSAEEKMIVNRNRKWIVNEDRTISHVKTSKSNNFPERCPVMDIPFFLEIKNERGEIVPTYGGPGNSYTIPVKDETESKKDSTVFWREWFCHRRGRWMGTEKVSILTHKIVIHEKRKEKSTKPFTG